MRSRQDSVCQPHKGTDAAIFSLAVDSWDEEGSTADPAGASCACDMWCALLCNSMYVVLVYYNISFQQRPHFLVNKILSYFLHTKFAGKGRKDTCLNIFNMAF